VQYQQAVSDPNAVALRMITMLAMCELAKQA
jgi:hypothetical protein